MSATYDPTKLKDFGKDRMRFDLGDTNMEDPLLQDEEIQVIIDENPNSWPAAMLKCAEHIYESFSPEATMKVGPLTIDLQERAKFWEEKIQKLRSRISSMAVPVAAPSAGGYGDTTGSYFRTGIHDNNQ